jgi:hypothetical protein
VERPEIDLLLLSARPSLTPQAIARLRAHLTKPIDWAYLLHTALDHKVVNLVFQSLKAHAADLVPAEQMAQLQLQYNFNLWQSLRITSELIRVINLLEANHIEVLPLKGPVLALMLYENMFMREYKDIDILVRRGKVEAAQRLLMANGYRLNDSEDYPQLFSNFNEPYHTSLLGKREGGDVELELHWSVTISFLPFTLDNERIWDYATTVDMNGFQCRALRPEELLMLISMHGVKHRWNWMKWICDIAAFVERYPSLDWTSTLAKVEEFRSKRVLLLNLWLANQLFETPLPELVQKQLAADRLIAPLGNYIRRWLFNQSQPDTLISQVRVILFFLLVREHYRDRWPYVLHTIWHRRSPGVMTLIYAGLGIVVVLLVLLLLLARGTS